MSTSAPSPGLGLYGPAPRGETKSLAKGVAILEALAGAPAGLRLAEVVLVTGIAKPTAHRLLATLEATGLVQTLPDGRHRLGSACIRLGDAFLRGVDVRSAAHGELCALADATGETSHLGVLDGRSVVYIDKVDSRHAVRMVSRIGGSNPATTTSLGRAILAFSPDAVVDAVLAEPIPPRTPRTLTDPVVLRERLAAVRVGGVAVDDVENEDGIRCVGAPILDHTGRACAALSVSAPDHRLSGGALDAASALVRSAAQAVTHRIGGPAGRS